MMLSQFTEVPQDSINRLFGLGGGEGDLGSRSVVSFTNASLSADEQAVVIAQKLAEYLYQWSPRQLLMPTELQRTIRFEDQKPLSLCGLWPGVAC